MDCRIENYEYRKKTGSLVMRTSLFLQTYLDADDLNSILKYDLDYSISFLLNVKDIAYEDDLTKQTIYLYRRHNLNYIIPLLEYVDEDTIREEMRKK